MRTLITTVLSFMLFSAAAQAEKPRELPVKIIDANVAKFDPPLPSRTGRYEKALVLRLEADPKEWKNLPPAVETFLYIGSHELRPFATTLERERVIITFHDPDWQQLKGGEVMVLTTEHNDPIVNPDKYAKYPRFDPGIIGK